MKMPVSAHLTPLQEQVAGRSRLALTLLFAAVGAVLLIVCVNLGNLMSVRANQRARDTAICRALGANAGQLFRPVLAESLLIALSGGALGLLLAYAGVQILLKTSPIDIPRLDEVHVSLTVLLFGFCVSAFCGVVCGLWPAIRATRVESAEGPGLGRRHQPKRRHGSPRRATNGGIPVCERALFRNDGNCTTARPVSNLT
jgi:putative ABC transport system permease protein